MNNTRQLMLAWKSYAGDNRDELVNNFGIDTTTATISAKTYRNGVNNVMTFGTEESVNKADLPQQGAVRTLRGQLHRCRPVPG